MRKSERWENAYEILECENIVLDDVFEKDRGEDHENRTMLWFKVSGSKEYTVTLCKQNGETSCTCHWASMRDATTMCSHQIAAHLFMVNNDTDAFNL